MAFSNEELFYQNLINGIMGHVFKKNKALGTALLDLLQETDLLQWLPSPCPELPFGLLGLIGGIDEEKIKRSQAFALSSLKFTLSTRGKRGGPKQMVIFRSLASYFERMIRDASKSGEPLFQFARQRMETQHLMGIDFPQEKIEEVVEYAENSERILSKNPKKAAWELAQVFLGKEAENLRCQFLKTKKKYPLL